MNEIKIYLDKERKNEIDGDLEFDNIIAGKTTLKKIYVYNVIEYPLNVEFILEGEFVRITKTINKLIEKQLAEIEFEFTPKITIMKPIKAKLKIKIDYLIK